MRILLSNDDSAFADGISAAYNALIQEHDVTVIAPDRNCSGASNALSLHNPLRVTTLDNGFHAVNGTPSDCVQIGVNAGFMDAPDLVVSGINHGPNLGDDVIYSGTVAAATEGRHVGLPAIAISMLGHKNHHFETAGRVLIELIQQLPRLPLQTHTILNVNVPNVPYSELQGWTMTRLGNRHKAENMVADRDPFGRKIYWYGRLGEEQDNAQGTDFYAVKHHQVSITPLSVDMTDHNALGPLQEWHQGQ